MSSTGEAVAPGPQHGAEAGDGRLGSVAQGECALASCRLLCRCCILNFVNTFIDWIGVCVGWEWDAVRTQYLPHSCELFAVLMTQSKFSRIPALDQQPG